MGLGEGASLEESSAVWVPCRLLGEELGWGLLAAHSQGSRSAWSSGEEGGLTEPLLPSSSQGQLLTHLCPKQRPLRRECGPWGPRCRDHGVPLLPHACGKVPGMLGASQKGWIGAVDFMPPPH